MFCTSCGKKINEADRFCTSCGTAISIKNPPHKPPEPRNQNNAKKRKNKVLLATAIVTAVVIAGIFGFYSLMAGRAGGALTPVADSRDGVLTLFNIPSRYNQMYAGFMANSGGIAILGAQNYDKETETIRFIRVSNGTARIPVWIENDDNRSIERYYGTNTFEDVIIIITDNIEFTIKPEVEIAFVRFTPVNFTSGGATLSWDSGLVISE